MEGTVRDLSSGEKSFAHYEPRDVGLTQLLFTGNSVSLIEHPTWIETIFGEGGALEVRVSNITVKLGYLCIEAEEERATCPVYMVNGTLEDPRGTMRGVIKPVFWPAKEVNLMSSSDYPLPFHFYVERAATPFEIVKLGREEVFYMGRSNIFKPKKGLLTAHIVPLKQKLGEITPGYSVELPFFRSRSVSFRR